MAVETSTNDKAAKRQNQPTEMSTGRRIAIGANVTLSIILAAALLVGLNLIFSKWHTRKDLAAMGTYGLSERTKSVLSPYQDDLKIWWLYTPDDQNENQQRYISRMEELFDEMRDFAPKVQITHVTSDTQRESLVERLSAAFGGEATQHKEALTEFDKLKTALEQEQAQVLSQAEALVGGPEKEGSWLGDFPLLGGVITTLKKDQEMLKDAADEIAEKTSKTGIPRYNEATSKASWALGEVKRSLEAVQESLAQLTTLADETANPDSPNMKMLREVAAETNRLVASLRESVGQTDAPLSGDPAADLKRYADQGVEVSKSLDEMVRRVDAFARKFPMVEHHPNWRVAVKMGPFVQQIEVKEVLQEAGESLKRVRLQVLGVLDTHNADEIAKAMAEARKNVSVLENNAAACNKLLTGLADHLSKLDGPSKALLEQARDKAMFKARLAELDPLKTKLEKLPELKLANLADKLKEDNICVVEAKGRVRVAKFDEVWPIRQSVAGGFEKKDELGRTFNGDSALASAMIAATSDKPFGTVIFVSFEPQPPPEMKNMFQQPPGPSWVPAKELSKLRERLEEANYKATDWNLGKDEEEPKVDEGPKVYVVLPASRPAPPNPFMKGMKQKEIGEAEIAKIRKILDSDGRVVFLASWEVRAKGVLGSEGFEVPKYEYSDLLEKEWGIEVDNQRRLVWVVPDRRTANGFGVVAQKFTYMPVGGFKSNELGKPMKGMRFLINDACPVTLTKDAPAGVNRDVVLTIPDEENYIGADIRELVQIIDELQNPASDGVVQLKSAPTHGPFDAMVVAERTKDGKSDGRVAVIGFGACMRDTFLGRPVVQEGQERLRFDAAPMEHADLFVNTLHWVQGEPKWIARGPAPVPRIDPIDKQKLYGVRVLVWAVWPVLVFFAGVVLWMVRRK